MSRASIIMEKISGKPVKESVYAQNLGMVEMFKFMEVATKREQSLMDKLLDKNLFRKAWELLKKVTGSALIDQKDIVDK